MKIYTDGGSRGNPGPSAWAFVTDTDYAEGGFIGLRCTNNEAEYMAMVHALKFAHNQYFAGYEDKISIYTDSRLLEGQLMCDWKIKASNLIAGVKTCKTILSQNPLIHIYYIPREQNKEADSLVNEILDAQKGL